MSHTAFQGTLNQRIQPLSAAVKRFERKHLLQALAVCKGNKTETARCLGISRKNLWEKLRKHEVSDAEIRQGISASQLAALCPSTLMP
jgi:DNA-binding NtrC family response regulator